MTFIVLSSSLLCCCIGKAAADLHTDSLLQINAVQFLLTPKIYQLHHCLHCLKHFTLFPLFDLWRRSQYLNAKGSLHKLLRSSDKEQQFKNIRLNY